MKPSSYCTKTKAPGCLVNVQCPTLQSFYSPFLPGLLHLSQNMFSQYILQISINMEPVLWKDTPVMSCHQRFVMSICTNNYYACSLLQERNPPQFIYTIQNTGTQNHPFPQIR
ncbi:hypothetical protein GDO78_001965 [Eleutherodactylus coqui]|uniref:Uncharacterized protein n=1 Tax=Eleutherodactylus coqui TaxID=57060 RepID=A0A8J6FUF8_ELECQ|nr:hypothetical protein GDO78_001965 [Eleutherodactylus coqui]